MPHYINERAKESKKFILAKVVEGVMIYKRTPPTFSILYYPENGMHTVINPLDTAEKEINKALEFARKNIIIK
jgi:hypothetical protein